MDKQQKFLINLIIFVYLLIVLNNDRMASMWDLSYYFVNELLILFITYLLLIYLEKLLLIS